MAQVKLATATLDNADTSSSSTIDWYTNKNILITGATGFIGKVVLEKVLRCLSSSNNRVYVMLRSKRGQTAHQRVEKMLNNEPLKHLPESTHQQVIAIEGDMSIDGLGLSASDRELLRDNVNVVFNLAASVQFDAPLKQNLRDNYLGVRNLLALCETIKRLDCLVHVSTFYTNCHLPHIEEKVLPMNRDCEKMAELISWLPDDMCDTIAPQLMENRPNTYIFTKAMAENLVSRYQGRFPIAIVRPSIVVPSVKEPSVAWVDNVNGPMGLGSLASLGLLRTIDWNYWGVADFVPVDYVSNCILTVAPRCHLKHPTEIKVYNASSSSLNPLTWGQAFEGLRKQSFAAPPYKMLRIPIDVPKYKRANKITFILTKIFSELLFAYVVDFILMLCGQKKILLKLTNKLQHGYDILRTFTTHEWTCSNENYVAAYEELADKDREIFSFDIRSLDWNAVMGSYYHGARKLILKEDPSNIGKALIKMKILYVFEFTVKLAFYALLSYVLYNMFNSMTTLVNQRIFYVMFSKD